MLKPEPTTRFRRELRQAGRRGWNVALLEGVVRTLAQGDPLPAKYRDHSLVGEWLGSRELHIQPDWLLIYRVDGATLHLERTGTHSDLF